MKEKLLIALLINYEANSHWIGWCITASSVVYVGCSLAFEGTFMGKTQVLLTY